MRVLHVVGPGVVGGLERVVQLLALGYARAGNEVHVAAILDPVSAAQPHPLLAALAAGGVTTHPVALPGRAYRREWVAMRELYRRLCPDVVHTHGYRPDVVDAPPARGLGIPTLTTVHGFTGGGWKNRLYERLQRHVYRKFAAVVVVSRVLRERLLRDGIAGDRIHLVQNAWEETTAPYDRETARRTLGADREGFRIGWVGRLSDEKGPDVLVDALAHLNDLPIAVSVVGAGPEEGALRTRAGRSGVAGRLRWHGLVPDASRAFTAFDVFVLSSRTEGTPIVLFEAMAAGVPIVATSVGGVPDAISPAEAILVPSEDPVALADAVRSVYDDPAAARARAARARQRLLTQFALQPWIARYDRIYRGVTNQTLARVPA